MENSICFVVFLMKASLNKQNLLKGLNKFVSEDDIWCFYFPFYALPVLSILLDKKCSIWRVLGCSKLIFVLDRLSKKPPIESSKDYLNEKRSLFGHHTGLNWILDNSEIQPKLYTMVKFT